MDIALDFHKDYIDWKSRLNFYLDEINFFFKELNMVFDQNKQNLARMEFIDEYEAILDKKKETIASLLERIEQAEKDNINNIKEKSNAKTHHQLHLDILKFERSFIEMKKGFKRFASHND